MKYGKTKKFVLIILGVFVLIFVVVCFSQKIGKTEKQNPEITVTPGSEILAQGIVKNLGDLEITIFQAEEAEYYNMSEQKNKKYYRIFLKVSNWNSSEKQTISEIILKDNSDNSYQLDDSIASSPDLEKLGKWVFYPMVTVDGFIVFPSVNENAVKMNLVIKNKDRQVKFEFRK